MSEKKHGEGLKRESTLTNQSKGSSLLNFVSKAVDGVFKLNKRPS